MTLVMLLLAWLGNAATPLVLLGDRLSVFIPPGPFLAIMGRVGGYTHLKELGLGSMIAGQIIVGAFGGLFYSLTIARREKSRLLSLGIFFLLPFLFSLLFLWPQLGTSYQGWPIRPATIITCLGLAISFLAFERTLVLGFHFLTRPSISPILRRSDAALWSSAVSACWRPAGARQSSAGSFKSRPSATMARSTKVAKFNQSRLTTSSTA